MVSKENENGMQQGFQFQKPENLTKWESFQRAIYNPQTKEFLGRTSKNWGQLLIFYTIFYAILAALFAVCMQGLLATLDDKQPSRTLDDSLIGTNPGIGFRPISERTEEGSLIWFNLKNQTTSDKWIHLLDKFLADYSGNQTGENFQQCSFEKRPDPGHICTVDLDNYGPCSPSNKYGYGTSSPCVFLKLNKIFAWQPEFHTTPQPEMPSDLKEIIDKLPENNRTQVWISCQGENPVDKENVLNFGYYPNRGFAGYYFPYTNLDNYLSPLIAVEIRNPKPNVIINIECRAWANNIKYVGGNQQREGSIHFEILLDDQ